MPVAAGLSSWGWLCTVGIIVLVSVHVRCAVRVGVAHRGAALAVMNASTQNPNRGLPPTP